MHDDKLAALKTLTANNPDLLDALLATATKTDAAAQEAKAVYKDAPEWAQALLSRLDALEATVKAAPPEMAALDEAAVEVEALDEAVPEMEMAEMDDGPLLGEADLQAIAAAVVAAIAPALDLEKKMRGYMDEMKGMLGSGIATKDASIAALDQRVKSLEGDQPLAAGYRASADASTVLPADVAERFKSTPHVVGGPTGSGDPISSFLSSFNLGGN